MDKGIISKKIIADLLHTNEENISNLCVVKKGLTNKSYTFQYNYMPYIIRIPGVGSNKLINREQEFEVYQCIKSRDICDELVYINANTGYKVTKFYPDARTCNPYIVNDVKRCIEFLRNLHSQKLYVDHIFHLFQKIDAYEKLRKNKSSIYSDYMQTKANIFSVNCKLKLNIFLINKYYQ